MFIAVQWFLKLERMNPHKKNTWWPITEQGAVVLVMLFVAAIALFPIRNNDIWWHLSVGKILAGGAFISRDPFMFSVPALPWVPHAWLSSLSLYTVHALASEPGLLVLRALLVGGTFWLLLRLIRRLGVALVFAAPIVLIALLLC